MSADLTLAEILKLRKLLAVAVRVTLVSSGTAEAARFAKLTDVIWSAYETQDPVFCARLQKSGLRGLL